MLLKFKLPFPLVKSFLEAGYTPRVISGTEHFFVNGTTDSTNYPTSQGILADGGVPIRIGHLRLSPEVRYPHWNNTPILVCFGHGPARNQRKIRWTSFWGRLESALKRTARLGETF
jgi:hypothetical protein